MDGKSERVTAGVLIIGDEILSGRTQDVNLNAIANFFAVHGVELAEARVVGDRASEIVAALDALRSRYDYVVTTGGIGPTHDDITTASVAKAFGRKVIRHPEAERRLRAYFGDRANPARLRMAEVPDGPGVDLIDNHVSVAPGYRIENVYVMAGVPSVARAMLDAVLPTLRGGAPVYAQSVDGTVREGDIAAPLADIQARYPATAIGSYPFLRQDKLGTSIVVRSTDKAAIAAAIAEVAEAMRRLGADPVLGPAP